MGSLRDGLTQNHKIDKSRKEEMINADEHYE
jgi:hypothetical protein